MQARFMRNLMALCLSVVMFHSANAQNADRIYIEPNGWSLGTIFGMSDLWGDVGTQSLVDHYTNGSYFNHTTFIGGFFGRYTVHPCFGLRFQMAYGSLYATDDWNKNAALKATSQMDDAYQRYARGQDARDFILETTCLMEFLPLRINPEAKSSRRRGQPFIAAGISIFHFTPYSRAGLGGQWTKTYNLDIEGQGWANTPAVTLPNGTVIPGATYPKQYSEWQPAIPLAIGYKWDIGQHLVLGLEYMWRMTFTDYLDGVSGKYVGAAAFQEHLSPHDAIIAQMVADKGPDRGLEQPNAAGNLRGIASNNDSYSTISFTLAYKVFKKTRTWWH
jgi:uncharacterized protein DUF6089